MYRNLIVRTEETDLLYEVKPKNERNESNRFQLSQLVFETKTKSKISLNFNERLFAIIIRDEQILSEMIEIIEN